jgi:hypothetical protein
MSERIAFCLKICFLIHSDQCPLNLFLCEFPAAVYCSRKNLRARRRYVSGQTSPRTFQRSASRALSVPGAQRPGLAFATTNTAKSLRPAKRKEVAPASLLIAEPDLQLRQSPRTILFGYQSHGPKHYRLWPLESNGYPSDPKNSSCLTKGHMFRGTFGIDAE